MKCKCCKKEFKRILNAQTYCSDECRKQKKREYSQEYSQRPDVKQKKREYFQEYSQRPDVKQRHKGENYVHLPIFGVGNKGMNKRIYADGCAKEIQKQIPQLLNQSIKKLLKEKEATPNGIL